MNHIWHVRDGVRSYVPGLAEALLRRGHEVIILSSFSYPEEPAIMGKVATAVELLPFSYTGKLAAVGKFSATRKALQRWRPDVIHFQGLCGGTPADAGLHIAVALFPDGHARTAITNHTSIEMLKASSRSAFYPLYLDMFRRFVERRFGAILGFSQYDRQLYPQARRFYEIGLGVEIEDFVDRGPPTIYERLAIPQNHQIVLFLGRLEPNKGVHHLIRAFELVHRARPETTLVLGGVVPRSAPAWFGELMNRVTKHTPGVVAPGFLRGADKTSALLNSDVVCLPSCFEMFPVTVLEGWAAAKPVVAGNTGGSKVMVRPGVDGFQVAFGNASDLAARIITLLDDPSLRRRMGEAGHAKAVPWYTWPLVAARAEDAYRHIS